MQELSFQHYLLGLFAVANNIPAIPHYLNLVQGRPRSEQDRLCFVATLTAFLTMLISMWTGLAVLEFFDISLSAFRIAGGLLLLNAGFGMMTPAEKPSGGVSEQAFSKVISTAVIPIGIPLTTGAGTMSTVILFAESLRDQFPLPWKLIGAIGVMTAITFVAFRRAPLVASVLGDTGMDVVTKVFGLITLANVQFILSEVQQSFPHLA
jgi:multiple antibiotic resistance protein